MSGFEVAGLVFGILPVITAGLAFYEKNTKNLRHHEEAMNDLIVSLHVEHCRFRNSCEMLLNGLLEETRLVGLLDDTTEEAWKKALDGDLELTLKKRLGVSYFGYTQTMEQLRRHLKRLEQVVGLEDKKPWHRTTRYRKLKWHSETWKKMSDCLAHSTQKQLLVDIGECNTRLEKLTPKIFTSEPMEPPKMEKTDIDRLEFARTSAQSLYCALCSGWLCGCSVAHYTHFRLEDRTNPAQGCDRFKLSFKLSNGQDDKPTTELDDWHEAEFETEEEEQIISLMVPRLPRVSFAPETRPDTRRATTSKQITDLCRELRQATNITNDECIGFIVEEGRKHYMHLPKRCPIQSGSRDAISLHHLLFNKGNVFWPFPVALELLDKYEVALLLASSLLQLHTTPWLGDQWSTEDIKFVPTKPDMALRDCAFITKSFPSTSQLTSNGSGLSQGPLRQALIRNEAVFRLGATLVELSTTATLQAQETPSDRNVVELADFITAERLSKQVERNNVRQWNDVVDLCLHCSFHVKPDFSKKEFRKEFYQWVVVPLQRLYDDAKPSS